MPEFSDWLYKGLGRAAIHLKNHDSKVHREALLHACTHNLAYDRQCEERSPQYLIDLIELSGDSQFYRDRILNAVQSGPQASNNDDLFDLGQLFELGAHFAKQGDGEIRQVMRVTFEQLGFAEAGCVCAEQLVELDGQAALLTATKDFDQLEASNRAYYFGRLTEALERRDGQQPLPSAFDHLVAERRRHEEQWQRPASRHRLSYAAIKTQIMNGKGLRIGWTAGATDEELTLLASDLVAESDPVQVVRFLKMFRRRAFPGDPSRLLEIARSSDPSLALNAMAALTQIGHPEIRPLAVDASRNQDWRGLAVEMLVRNHQPDDYSFIETLFESKATDESEHKLSWGLHKYVEAHRSPEAQRCLLLAYERGPCSQCRKAFVKELIAIDRLPENIREECLYDADLETRQLVTANGIW